MNKKLEHIVIRYLNKLYGDLEVYKNDKYPNRIFYGKGGEVYMEFSVENNYLWVDYIKIWRDLINLFNLSYDEHIQFILKKWIKETYNINFLKGLVSTCYNHLKIDNTFVLIDK